MRVDLQGITLAQLRAFVETGRVGSFTRAAASLYSTQSAISQHVRALESALSVQLFYRGPRRLELTAQGRVIYETALVAVEKVEEIPNLAEELRQGRLGNLAIAASVLVGTHVLPRIVSHFMKEHPKISVKVDITFAAQAIQRVGKGEADLAFTAESPLSHEQNLTALPVLQDTLVLVGPRGSGLNSLRSVHVSHLGVLPLVFSDATSATRRIIEREMLRADVVPKVVLELSNIEAIKTAVVEGLGYSVISRVAVERELSADLLEATPIDGADFSRTLVLVWRESRLSTPARLFVDTVRSYAHMAPSA